MQQSKLTSQTKMSTNVNIKNHCRQSLLLSVWIERLALMINLSLFRTFIYPFHCHVCASGPTPEHGCWLLHMQTGTTTVRFCGGWRAALSCVVIMHQRKLFAAHDLEVAHPSLLPANVAHANTSLHGHDGQCMHVVGTQEWDCVSEAAKDLLSQLLQLQPSQRISAEECLAHPWLNPSTSRRRLHQAASLESPAILRKMQSLEPGASAQTTGWFTRILPSGSSPGEAAGSAPGVALTDAAALQLAPTGLQ